MSTGEDGKHNASQARARGAQYEHSKSTGGCRKYIPKLAASSLSSLCHHLALPCSALNTLCVCHRLALPMLSTRSACAIISFDWCSHHDHACLCHHHALTANRVQKSASPRKVSGRNEIQEGAWSSEGLLDVEMPWYTLPCLKS